MKQSLVLRDGARLAWQLDDFTDPWADAPTVLFVHGNSESGRAWDRWVGPFARDFRLLRPDLRGFGDSQAMPELHAWSLQELSADLAQLLDHLGLGQVHVVGAKLGGMMSLNFAAHHPDRVRSLAVVGSPVSGTELTGGVTPDALIREQGVGAWARQTMAARLGPNMPGPAHEWWANYMGQTSRETQLGFLRALPGFDVRGDLGRITCPTLVISPQADTPVGNPQSVGAWQSQIPRSRLEVVAASGYHAALTAADELAPRVVRFFRQVDGG